MKKISILMAASLVLIAAWSNLSDAAHPYKSFHFGLAPSGGIDVVSGQFYFVSRLSLRIQEKFTVFLAGGFVGAEEYDETRTDTYWNGYENVTNTHTESHDQEIGEGVVGFRLSLVQFVAPLKRTFFRFNPDKIKFDHEPELVKALKPYAEIVAGTSVGLGFGLEIQPITNFSLDVGVNAGFSFIAEEEGLYIAPRLLLGFWII